MHLATFKTGAITTFGVKVAGGVIDVRSLTASDGSSLPGSLLDLIQLGDPALFALERAATKYRGALTSLDDIVFDAPVPRPGKIVCLALNNSANAARIISGPRHPAFFSKPSSALIGHDAAIPLRREYGRVHPEPELAVVIGRTGRDIAPSDAFSYVFGYTVHNDITSPTMRTEDTYNYRAIYPDQASGGVRYVETHVSYPGRYKGADGFAPMGPWLVTRDEIADPHALPIACWHNDVLGTSDNTANLTHHIPDVLAWVSRFMTLEAGDIVSLRTALSAAEGAGQAIQNVDLNLLGGVITVTIDGIGKLRSTVEHRA